MEKQLFIDGNLISDIPSFYEEINRVFMAEEDWKLGNSLDAFNDLLYGGFGAIEGGEPVTLVWQQMEKNRLDLGYEVTRQYYEEKFLAHSAFNKDYFREKLEALNNGTGQTYFDMLLEIIADHPNIRVEPVETDPSR